mmetsp:Transcript_10612/g.23330  ORF Transcript_10612/g.23330 Transcript_10612/m.23330 type:complete len:344 (+) Transcript_10612:108-1139(+)
MMLLLLSILALCNISLARAFGNLSPTNRINHHLDRSSFVHLSRTRLYSSPHSANPTISNEIEQLMSKHDPILLFASRLLPYQTAVDASALYAWCRRLDEITDDPSANVHSIQQQLIDWEDRFNKLCTGQPVDEMDDALYQCLQRNSNSLNERPFQDMIVGMKSDAVPTIRTISSMEELEEYAYQVAGTVGLMLLPLLNADVEKARQPAIALGKAIQLINILRDASPDAALGRIYLPQDMLELEGVSNDDVLKLQVSDGYCRVVEKVTDRARELLREAEVGKSTLPGVGGLFVQIIVELYRDYLDQLQVMEYDNLNIKGERVKISTVQKVVAVGRALFTTVAGK